ncbi:nickel pincer cofactor biosynthesis protein LarC [Halomarina oriensis]|uniref:Putative nickel insertion protein n=1 Tax=Halomarina oriensis TaxID=671145 RepID=A0A6B0GSY6_9EURY|nr:nickel pincer cofactor biosynthesis protein LarC [Halomarina oriensis]MWG35793.1 nickel pincer cofactor biosynthesis protein LarC [Halomarina oriensis]
MRTLAFDGRMGASGDMLLGALLAAGADPAVLDSVEAALPVHYDVGATEKNGILATRVVVRLDGGDVGDGVDHGDDEGVSDAHHHGDDEDHDHAHHHEHSHDHAHGGDHAEGRGALRTYPEVVELVEGMALSASVEHDVLAVFERLGEAEARVHGTDLDETHFHEVGADDAVADVVGVCLLLDDLGVERVVTTPLATGGGEVTMSHGTYPVPTPATLNLADDASWSLRGGPVEMELLTPTGAALLAHLAEGVETLPTMRVETSGYGAGGYDVPEYPNVLRGIVGEAAGGLRRDPVRVLETNVDDVTPEVLGSLHETLAEVGARDVTVLPTTMKKSRPGHLVKVVVKAEDAERVARRLAEETGTLGVRETGVSHRFVADREFETVTLAVDGERYEVSVKLASAGEERFDVSAEFDDALAVARETGLPVREVMDRAETVARDR